MKVSHLASAALACSCANAYAITGDGVNCRSGPGTSFAVHKSYSKGNDVSITCQSEGTNVNGDSLWDKTGDGCYVADYYVKTGTSGYVKDKCSGGSSPPSPPSTGGSGGECSGGGVKSNKATVDLIAEFEGWRASVCE